MKGHGCIVIGWDAQGKTVFAKTFDFDENSEVEREQAMAAIEYVSNKANCDSYVAGEPSSILQKIYDWDKLDDKLAKHYEEDSESDLAQIGETAAIAFGYM